MADLIVFVIYSAITNEPLLFQTYSYVFKQTEANRKAKKLFEELTPRYRPTWFLPESTLKDSILFLSVLKPINNFYERVVFKFKSDGGQTALDFYPPVAEWRKHSADWSGKPLMIVVPGRSGTSLNSALFSTCSQLWQKYKIRTLVANRRGTAGVEITGEYPLNWIRCEDMDEIINYLALGREDTKGSRIFLYGHSLGGAFVHLYNGEKGRSGASSRLEGTIAVSTPYDMVKTVDKIVKNYMVDQVILKGCILKFRKCMKNPRFLRIMKEKGVTPGNQS